MEAPPDFKTLQEQIQSALVTTTRTVNQISSEDLAFHRSLNREVGEELDQKSNRLLEVAQSLLRSAASVSGLRAPELQDVDDVDNNWRGVVDVVDSLLEKADTCLDEYTGVIKRKVTGVAEESNSKKQHPSQLGKSFRNQNLLKPQLAFDHKPENFNDTPWKPLLTSKPHSLIPLEESLGVFTDQLEHEQYDYKIFLPFLQYALEPLDPADIANLTPEELAKSQERKRKSRLKKFESLGKHTNNRSRFRHPYETEILQLQYPESVYQKADPINYLPIETTTATWVDTFEGVCEMLEELKNATEIAVDLEHHDTRSYVGLVSLMQISTRSKDWVVDTLKPWRQDLQILNEVFADPKIVKVFHGAYMDIVWLQRDLGLYVTGLFDTHHASRALGYPGGSLAYLLKRFINFDADKKYQMADWRIRPLPEEMFFYARSDTHFLLYIYDNVRNELVDKSDPAIPENNRIEIVLQKSKDTSLMCYRKEIYDRESGRGPAGWFTLLSKTPAIQTSEQLAIFRAVHAWRDQVARTDDDSLHYVMSNQVLIAISKRAPTDMNSLYGVIHPISHNVKSRTGELLDIIKEAKAAGVDGPTAMDILKPGTMGAMAKQVRESSKAATGASSSTKTSLMGVTLPTASEKGSLRSETSKFWGGAFGSSIWDSSVSALNVIREGLTLAVPMPQLSSDMFSSNTSVTGNTSQTPTTKETASKADENEKMMQQDKLMLPGLDEDDSAFVLKRGRKRKSDAMGSGGDVDEDRDEDINALDEADEVVLERRRARGDKKLKAAKKREEKKELKRQRKKAHRESLQSSVSAAENEDSKDVDMAGQAAEAEEAEEDEEEEEAEEDFDYSKAASVLHSKFRGGGAGFAGKKEKKGKGKGAPTPFDPYTKSANAAKGMRRQQGGGDGEKGERSMTFRK